MRTFDARIIHMATKANDNMSVWNAVCETDPKYTKTVNQRGGFTAICAQSQVLAATEQFGPVGVGWGYEVAHSTIGGGDAVLSVADVTLWHGKRDNAFGPERGIAPLVAKGRTDDDAAKKATTNALTKLLSRLGFNADVFLGLYDDNQYVNDMRAKKAAENDPPASGEQIAQVNALLQERDADEKKLLGYYKVGSVDDLSKTAADHAIKALQSKPKKDAA